MDSNDKARVVNFGENLAFRPAHLYAPESETEVLEILARHRGRKFRTMGSRHSWSDAIVTHEVLLDLGKMNRVDLDPSTGRVTVGAGCQVKRLLAELLRQGNVTTPSVGLITEQTIAGAISTGTHGSGKQSLSHFIDEVRLAHYDPVTGDPKITNITGGPELQAARCSLGTLGVILSVTLQSRATYRVEESLVSYDTLEEVLRDEEEHPLQQFYLLPWRWTYVNQRRRESEAPRSFVAPLYRAYWLLFIDLGLHWILLLLVRAIGRRGPVRWFYRSVFSRLMWRVGTVTDRSDRMLTMKHHLFRHIEIELFVTRRHLAEAAGFVRSVLRICGGDETTMSPEHRRKLDELGLADELSDLAGTHHHHYPICFRRILADDTLISMASDETHYSISLISYVHPENREPFLRLAALLARSMGHLFEARAHWGKVCPLDREEVEQLYPHLEEFRSVRRDFDPGGVFTNEWVGEVLGLDSRTTQAADTA